MSGLQTLEANYLSSPIKTLPLIYLVMLGFLPVLYFGSNVLLNFNRLPTFLSLIKTPLRGFVVHPLKSPPDLIKSEATQNSSHISMQCSLISVGTLFFICSVNINSFWALKSFTPTNSNQLSKYRLSL